MAASPQNDLAKKLKSLHVRGKPVVFTNVYDAATAGIVCAHPATKAVTTASYAIAAQLGVEDNDMTQAENLAGIDKVAKVISKHPSIPFAVDLQDGYDIETAIREIIKLGVVGCNIEDLKDNGKALRAKEDAVGRVKRVLAAAAKAGVLDFCINARTDVLAFGGSIDDAIDRGKAYLAAGATTIYVWGGGGGRGVSSAEVKELVAALGGMLNVKMNLRPGFLGVKELSNIGVARISVGPELFHAAMKGYKEALDAALSV